MKTYSSYKDSGVEWIGNIPSHWGISKTKFYGELNSGDGFRNDLQGREYGDFPFFKVSDTNNIGNEKLLIKSNNYVSNEDFENERWTLFQTGNIVFPKIGMGLLLNKRRILNQDSFIDNNMMGLEPNHKLDVQYTFYYYLLVDFKDYCSDGTVPSINESQVGDIPVLIPPLHEQQKIVSFLDKKSTKVDQLIHSKEKKIELLKEKRTSLINKVVTKGLNPDVEMKDSGVEWIGEIPSSWKRVKLIWISNRIGDGLHSTPNYVESSDYHFINGNNLVDGSIKLFSSTKCVSEEEYQKHYIELTPKTLLMSINGTIGNLSFYKNEKVILGKSSCYINLKYDINEGFIYYLMMCSSIQSYYTYELTGTTIFNLSLNSVRNTPIILPPISEQHQIVSYLDKETKLIDETISSEQKKIELLKEYKQSLISEVVTGKRKVTTDE